jgi:acetylornithine deacetylase
MIPAFDSGKGSAATSLALKLAGQNETFAVSYGTEAGFFQGVGPSTVICGPGSIDQAHKPNEFVEVAEIEKCLGFMGRLADWAAAPN